MWIKQFFNCRNLNILRMSLCIEHQFLSCTETVRPFSKFPNFRLSPGNKNNNNKKLFDVRL